MTYDVGLFEAGVAVGLLLVLSHGWALAQQAKVAAWLKALPRNDGLGQTMWAGVVLWALWLVLTIDLGEFAGLRHLMALGTALLGILVWVFVRDYLAVRALAAGLLLGAEVLLSAAFMQAPVSRLLLVMLAYGWILGGVVIGAVPWLLRDALGWLCERPWRLSTAAWAGVFYGAVVLVAAFLFWRG